MSIARTAPSARQQRVNTLATELYAQHYRRLLAISTRNSPSPEDAEEALQDTFALFINHFDPSGDAPPLAWLTLTLKRRCWATYRHQRVLTIQPLSPAMGPGDRAAEDSSQRPLQELAEATYDIKNMRKAFTQLKPAERQALSMLAIGYSYREIAQRTGWTYTKVNRCITEGRAKLRQLTPTA